MVDKMIIDAVAIRVGNILSYNNELWYVTKTMHTKPGKGGAFMQVEMKSVVGNTKQNVRFRSSESVEKVRVDEKEFQFLYSSGDQLELMDNETYEQISINTGLMEQNMVQLLKEGMKIYIDFHEEKPLALRLPDTEQYEVEECEPALKGQTVASSYKPAIVNGGVRIMVPPFINVGDKIVVRTAELEYIERVK